MGDRMKQTRHCRCVCNARSQVSDNHSKLEI